MRTSTLRMSLLVTLVISLTAGAVGAVPHLRLTQSAPGADAELPESPEEIRLWFSQKPELGISRITLTGPDGEVALGDVAEGEENTLAAAVETPLAAGSYEVAWRTSSGDGHPIRGTFGFSVATTRD